MHQSSIENMQKCYQRFVKKRVWLGREKINVIDIGGANLNGSYADIFSGREFEYKAIDIAKGEGVDVVVEDPYSLSFEDQSIDIVVSGQAFEHMEFFWLLFSEMVRVLKADGILILIAPSAGPIHRYPVDCYRFYPDSFTALAKYAKCNVISIFHDDRGPWNDLVGVFGKLTNEQYVALEGNQPWECNRYETEIKPIFSSDKSSCPNAELMQGKENYLDVLKRLHGELVPNIYLEIGVRHGRSFALSTCESIGVDPLPEIEDDLDGNKRIITRSSDDFFELYADSLFQNQHIDFAFIDGMHLFEFALRDFINIERYSTNNTVVVIDDVFPNHILQAERLRQTAVWTGDIWKLGYCLAQWRTDLTLHYIDAYPTGLMVVTGLNSKNRILTENYNLIVREYKHKNLDLGLSKDVVERARSILPDDNVFWEYIKTLSSKQNL